MWMISVVPELFMGRTRRDTKPLLSADLLENNKEKAWDPI